MDRCRGVCIYPISTLPHRNSYVDLYAPDRRLLKEVRPQI